MAVNPAPQWLRQEDSKLHAWGDTVSKEIKEWLLAPEISVLRMLRQEDHQAFKTLLEGEVSVIQYVTVREWYYTLFAHRKSRKGSDPIPNAIVWKPRHPNTYQT